MTIEVSNTIHCDKVTVAGPRGLRCPHQWPVPVEQRVAEALREAEAAGWLTWRSGRAHYCPDHRDTPRAVEAEEAREAREAVAELRRKLGRRP